MADPAQVIAVNQAVDDQKRISREAIAPAAPNPEYPEAQCKRSAVVIPDDGRIGFYTASDRRGQFIENLGFSIPGDLQGDSPSLFVDYAPENYARLNGGYYLFVPGYNGTADVLRTPRYFGSLRWARMVGCVIWIPTLATR